MIEDEFETAHTGTEEGSESNIPRFPRPRSSPYGQRGGESTRAIPGLWDLERSFMANYLDELIIATLFRCDEASGMEIIAQLSRIFGVQFSPGTVYPHLHSLEERGILTQRECIRTKEYSICDQPGARGYLETTLDQFTQLTKFLEVNDATTEQTE